MEENKDNTNDNKDIIIRERIITITIFICLSLIIAVGTVYAPKEVHIIDKNEITTVYTKANTVEDVLDEIGFKKENAFIIPNINTVIYRGMEIYLFDTKTVDVNVDGEETFKLDVPIIDLKYVIQSQGIEIYDEDKIETNFYGYDENYFIDIKRVRTDVLEREVELGFNSILRPNPELLRGERKVVVPGEKGIKKEIVQITYENNEPVEENILEEKIIQKPVAQIMEFGTKERQERSLTSRHSSLENRRIVKEMVVEATAYTHTGNRTFTGIWPYEGIVAVDPNVIPLGTEMYVEGYGFAKAADTGGLIKGNIIDVFMDTRDKAINWGRRNVKIYILE